MTPTGNHHAPTAALSSPARQRQTFAVVMLGLYFITYNVGAVFLQARGVDSGQAVGSFVGFLSGAILAAVLSDALERLSVARPAFARQWNRVASRAAGAAMLLPGVLAFALFSLESVPWAGTRSLNVLLPMLWGTCLPVALRLFFRHAPPGLQAWFYGIAVGAGHLCWSLLTPLATMPELPTGEFLTYLNMFRLLSNSAFAALVWRLLRDGPDSAPSAPALTEASIAAGGHGGAYSAARLAGYGSGGPARLLLPLAAAFALSGMMGYLFFSRMATRGEHTEYMHLALAAAVPLLGLALSRRGPGLLRPLLALAVAGMAASPLLLLPVVTVPFSRAVFLVCATAQQILATFGTLALSRFALRSRHPALLTCSPWLASLAALPGNLLTARLFPALGLPPEAAAWAAAALCLFLLWPYRRAFPLPEQPAPGPDEARETSPDETRLHRFAVAFGLSSRETQLLGGILRGLTTEQLCGELDIRESTVRYHLTGLLRKSGQKTRARLVRFYGVWEPD